MRRLLLPSRKIRSCQERSPFRPKLLPDRNVDRVLSTGYPLNVFGVENRRVQKNKTTPKISKKLKIYLRKFPFKRIQGSNSYQFEVCVKLTFFLEYPSLPLV